MNIHFLTSLLGYKSPWAPKKTVLLAPKLNTITNAFWERLRVKLEGLFIYPTYDEHLSCQEA